MSPTNLTTVSPERTKTAAGRRGSIPVSEPVVAGPSFVRQHLSKPQEG